MTDEIVVVVSVSVLLFLVATVIPVFVVPRLVRAWEAFPPVIRQLGGSLMPFVTPVLVLMWTEIDRAITRRVKKTGNVHDDILWDDTRKKIDEFIDRFV